jgi:protease-4
MQERLKLSKRVWRAVDLPRRLRRLLLAPGNAWRRRFTAMDYVLITLPPEISALPVARGWLYNRLKGEVPWSIFTLAKAFQRIAADPRLKGIVLNAGGLDLRMSQADIQALRGHLLDLRRQGKRVVFFAHGLNTSAYSLACAADDIILQPGGELAITGLRSTLTFQRDALAAIGIEIEKIAISPYKSAADTLTRSTISAEAEEQFNWLLDSVYEGVLNTIASGRGIAIAAAKTMIDGAPYTATDALEAGYIDAVCNEEALPEYLESRHILDWREVARKLPIALPPPGSAHVAVVEINGPIVPGKSRRPPFPLPLPLIGGAQSGDETVVRQIRQVMRNKSAAALILFVNSPGGSATASEAIAAALDNLAKTRPVVICMHSLAASGGYYVATPGSWIVAQPGTITGSIGVLSAKAYTQGMFSKLRMNRLEFSRGANATIGSDVTPLTLTQRAQYQQRVEHIYHTFTRRVADSRKMTETTVDAVAGGRVWTGAQAIGHGLVDELGGIEAALRKARNLAGLADDAPLKFVKDKKRPFGPLLAEYANPGADIFHLADHVRLFYSGKPQMLLPFSIEWHP